MRVVKKNIKFNGSYNKMYYEQFGSYEEYLKVVEERNKTNPHRSDGKLENLNGSWYGVKSYEEARNLLVNGWEKQVDYLKKQLMKEIDLCDDKKVVRTFNDVAGYMPIVPNAIMGLPNSMINQRMDRKKSKIIKFLIGMNRSCAYGSKEIIDKMSKVLARIAILEKHGYRCRLEIFGSFHDGNASSDKTIACHSVLLKSENQLFDLRRVAFPIAHTAMQRVFGFGWENSIPLKDSEYHFGALGRAVQYWNKNAREDLLNAINENKEKLVYVSMDTDIEEMFGKEGGIVNG